MYKIAIAGTGYVGLVTGVCLAEKGFNVTCMDVDSKKIDMLKKGICPIYEPGLEELMSKNKEKIVYTTDPEVAYKDADVIYIGVGTPERKDGSANLDYVKHTAKQIANVATVKNCVVVIKSTVPIGTNKKILSLLRENAKNDVNFEIASNPEFLAQGSAVNDTLNASRIVFGTETEHAKKVLNDIYSRYGQKIVSTDIKSAEMIKYASNDFLALKISYINEIANLCEIVGANIEDVALGMGYDPRIGNKFLKAGIGYGGSCFPKDTKALHWFANFHDYEVKTIKSAIEVNSNQKLKLFKKSRKYFDDLHGKKVAVLGLTFKPNTDDLREAPSLENIPILLERGADIYAWDPVGIDNFKNKTNLDINYCSSIDETLKDADICFIFTEWEQVINYDVTKFSALMKTPIVLDGRNCFSLEQFDNVPIIYESIGRKEIRNFRL